LANIIDHYKELLNYNYKNLEELSSKSNKVLIDAFIDVPSYISTASIIGRIIQINKDCEPLAITTHKIDSSAVNLLHSLGIKEIFNINNVKFRFSILVKTFIATFITLTRVVDKNALIKYSFEGIKIGDLIFDSFIRHGNKYRLFKIWSWPFIKHLLLSFRLFFIYSAIFKMYNVSYIIASDKIYTTFGLLVRVGYFRGAKVLLSRGTSIRIYDPASNDEMEENQYWPSTEKIKLIIKNKLYEFSDSYLDKRFSGNINQHDVLNAFKDKTVYTKEELIYKFSLNSTYPIVFIMPHAFSDAPHGNKRMIFTGYYEWFLETIQVVNEIKNVNWFVKPHPSSHLYGEEGEVKQIIKNMNYKNIHLVPEDINTYSVIELSTTVVTVNGSIGLEMACIGKKPIIASDSMYSGYGIAHEPKSKKEFFNLLQNIKRTNFNLSEEKIMNAKSILYWVKKGIYFDSKTFDIPTIVTSTDQNNVQKQKLKQYELLYNNLKKISYQDDPFYTSVTNMLNNNEKYSQNYTT